MVIYTSYFYKVRFLTPYQIPVSTALWDPKWFHDFKTQDHIFLDSRGVINGVRMPMLAPGPTCSDLCHGREGCRSTPDICDFLTFYRKQIYSLNFNSVMELFESTAATVKRGFALEKEPQFMLMFHEAPTNPCSERVVVTSWFKDNGHAITEWDGER